MSRPARRSSVALAAAALVASVVAGLPVAQANPTPDTSMQVPWNQVGDGWTLATWNPVPGRLPGERPDPDAPAPAKAADTLFLIDPAGHRYAVTTFEPTDKGRHPRLVDWSGNGGRALLTMGDSVIVVDLHTGSQSSFPSSASGGSLVLKSTTGCSPSQALMAYDPAANTTRVLLGPTVNDGRVIDAMTFGEGYRS